MDEQEFDSLMQSRPFGRDDAMRADSQLRRRVSLAMALWGRTPDDLQRQLLAPSTEIPSGFDLTDLRELQRSAEKISEGMSEPQYCVVVSLGIFFSDYFRWRSTLHGVGSSLRDSSPCD